MTTKGIFTIAFLIILCFGLFYLGFDGYTSFKREKFNPDLQPRDLEYMRIKYRKSIANMVFAIVIMLALFIKFLFWLFNL